MTLLHNFDVFRLSACHMPEDAARKPDPRSCIRTRARSLAPSLAPWLERLVASGSGNVMVELAIVALPFLILLMGAFDIGFYYWGSEELENATAYGARLVRTGQVQADGMTQAQLKAAICSQTSVLPSCISRLRLDVRSGPTFADITPPSPMAHNGRLKADWDFAFSPGAGGDIVLVSTYFKWRLLLKPSDYILGAATAMQNEPF
jgi:Flp pilus assembly protein TadG